MTSRLYYTDSTLASFDAIVVAATSDDGRHELVLDRTASYRPPGGQPSDTGRRAGPGIDVPVLDAADRDDGEVAHVVSAPIPVGAPVRGEIDWARRFDHMQQHTGQHI